jgi:hypothetical protein
LRHGGFLVPLEQHLSSEREEARSVEAAEELDQRSNEAGPTGLVARADPRAVVSVEVFVEEDVIAPVPLKRLRPPEYGPPPVLATQEDSDEACGDLPGHDMLAYLEVGDALGMPALLFTDSPSRSGSPVC